MDNDHILIIIDFNQLKVEVSVGQAEEVAPDGWLVHLFENQEREIRFSRISSSSKLLLLVQRK